MFFYYIFKCKKKNSLLNLYSFIKFLHSEDEEVLEYEEGIGNNLINL